METPDWYDERFDPYLLAVGRIVGMFSTIDSIIDQAIWELANLEVRTGACLTAQLGSHAAKLNAFLSLLQVRGANASQLKPFSRMANDIAGLSRQRNRYVHDPISIGLLSGIIRRREASADKRLKFEHIDTDLEEMAALLEKLRAMSLGFSAAYYKVRDELNPWLRTQYEQSEEHLLWQGHPQNKTQETLPDQLPPSQE